ncbi:MAG: type II toxin-antitoxin system RelE/ParE family toxin [Alphaproteobacteria bacterium]|nr:type II toxin-antitoxin system RelE/ParE family toxin [Alphaproteobacteria bacterium]
MTLPVWTIEIGKLAETQLNELDRTMRLRLINYMMERISPHPNPLAISKSMKSKFHGARRFRVGDYRILAEIDDESKIITIYQIGHRSTVYDE